MRHKYILGDSSEVLKKLDTGKFKLIITSPPYNVGKEYETKSSIESYLSKQEGIVKELVRVLHEEGSLCWQVGNFVHKGEVFPLDIYYYEIFKKLGLKLRNRIIWHFGHGLHTKSRFSGRYETILWFTKSDKYTFNLNDVRVESKYPGKRHFKGPRKGELSSNPNGKNPSDIWEVDKKVLQDWEREIWEVPNVKANHVEKTEHPCQYPIELVGRCVLALSSPGDWVLDPYAGVGSTVLASLIFKRNAVGIEKFKKYLEKGEQRILDWKNGKLKYRPITKPIYDHRQSKLSLLPDEFKMQLVKK